MKFQQNNTTNKKKIVILATGGTIVCSGEDEFNVSMDIKMADIIQAIPGIRESAEIEVQEVSNIPSSAMTSRIWIDLATAAQNALNRPDIDAVIVTHGTDTMEESAFFLNMVLKTTKPVVFTGAMRTGTSISADGPANLVNAVALACDEASCCKGVLVCLNGQINTARDCMKTNTLALETFQGRDVGFLGMMVGGVAHYYMQSTRPHTVQTEFSLADLAPGVPFPRVDIVYGYAGDDSGFVSQSIALGARGIVVAGMGNGTISPKMEAALGDAVSHGIVVVRSTRVPAGLVTESVERWKEYGLIPSQGFSPQKARILLQLLLLKGADHQTIDEAFQRY